jgi:error-prone DNA polymerase
MNYIELHARSAFSFLEGASLPETMAQACAQQGISALALLDRDGVYGAPRFHAAAKKLGITAHIGAEVTVRDVLSPKREDAVHHRVIGSSNHRPIARTPAETASRTQLPDYPITQLPDSFRLSLLVASRTGYQNLCRLITRMKLRAPKHAIDSRPETFAAATFDEVAEFAEGLICLTGGDEGPLTAALRRGAEARKNAERLISIFGRDKLYVELQRHFNRDEEARNHAVIEIARSLKLPLVATNGVRHATPAEREILDVLTCIRTHTQLDTAGRLISQNSERHLKSPHEMAHLFADLPEAIANTEEISSRLRFSLADLGYEFPRYPVPEGETMMSFLCKRTDEGARERYLARARTTADRNLWTRARRQIERELGLIEKLNLAGYFLIVWDIVRFCLDQGILVQGRGSAANSAVCYSLGITAVDPVGMDLLFERFLSEERGEWPDIDLDLPSGDRRERVIQHVYECYGKLGAAMTANVITYRGRSAAREMGKALGFDAETTGRLSAMVGSWEYKDPDDTLERQFRDAGFDLRHHRMRKFFELCLSVQDLPRHLGQHSGGMVICQSQLDSVVPLEPASMPGRVVVQWDKDDCADMGIIKVDLLGLGMMAVLEDSLGMIRNSYGEEVDLAQIPPDDSAVYAALQKADTVGMFQIESRAQMSCLPRLYPRNFYDIVVQVAIIRPGPIVGDMVNPFIKRRQGREPVEYPHPSLEPVLERTLGVPLFQEQLLRMAMIAAGFTGGQAEELRRAFGFKRSESRMADIERKLRAGMEHNGIARQAQDAIVKSITSFALYGFPESHAASFALLAYASAYLKCHHLAAFTAAMLNNQPMGFYHPSTLVKDAQRHGLRILPMDMTQSEWLCTLEVAASQRSRGVAEEFNPPRRHEGTTKEHHLPQRHRDPEKNLKASKSPDSTALQLLDYPITRLPSSFAVRLGLRYARGLREDAAQALVRARQERPFQSIDELVRRIPELRKNELVLLAEIGALNRVPSAESRVPNDECQSQSDKRQALSIDSPLATRKSTLVTRHSPFGTRYPPHFHRRDALWQVERAIRPAGALLERVPPHEGPSPLEPMNAEERLVADYRGTGLTVGPHPMAYRRQEMERIGVRRAIELQHLPNGKRVRAAGCIIARQRPGTAHGFVFLSLEDETGIANAIITPDLFERHRFLLVSERFLLVEGMLQNLDGVISVKTERISRLNVTAAETHSHDFH